MNSFPSVLQSRKNGSIPLPNDIGTNMLLECLYLGTSKSTLGNSDLTLRPQEAIKDWVLCFETDPDVIAERQEVVRYALENPDFSNAIDAADVRPEMPFQNELDKYTGVLGRFSTFSDSATKVARVLDGKKKPRALEAVQEACEETRKRVDEAKSHLDPEFELRIEGGGSIKRGLLDEFLHQTDRYEDRRRRLRSRFEYVLVNKGDGSVKRESEDSAGVFGVNSYYNFIDGMKWDIENAFNRILHVPFFARTYRMDGTLRYNPHDETVTGKFRYSRNDGADEGVFKLSGYAGHVPKGIVELARFRHNFQVVGNFEPTIKDFEDLLVQLKAVAAATRFLRNLQDRGYPLVFPDILPQGSDEDIHAKNMYHPLLAYSRNGRVVPNDVSTTASNNARLITGANNNGKTSYMDAVGLSYVMFQAGLPIIAEEARMKPKRNLLTHYVRPGDIQASQSRFAHECARFLELVQGVSDNSLILCDELYTGTAPQDGEVVSELAVKKLLQTGATLFFTTHYHGLGDRLRESPYVTQLCCKLDYSTSPPSYTYKIVPGISRESDGLVVAAQYGVNEDNLNALLRQKERQGDFKLR